MSTNNDSDLAVLRRDIAAIKMQQGVIMTTLLLALLIALFLWAFPLDELTYPDTRPDAVYVPAPHGGDQ